MPIFEYMCKNCNSKFELLVRSQDSEEHLKCPQCDSEDLQKMFSAFGMKSSSSGHSCSSDHSCGCGSCSSHDCHSCHCG